MPIRNGEYVRRTNDEIFSSQVNSLLEVEPNANPRAEATLVYALLQAQSRTIARNQEQSLKNTYNAAYIEDAEGKNLTKKARNLGFIRNDAIAATGVVTFSRSEPASQDYVVPAGTVVETLSFDPVSFETVDPVTLTEGTTEVEATVKAVEGGSDGNVGSNAIQAMPSPPTGIGSVNNSEPTGDPSITDTNGDPLVEGRDRESDGELRSRVLKTDAVGEGPSADGIRLALQQTEAVISSDVNINPNGSATADGLDPYHTEVVVYGGDILDISDTLIETMSVTTLLRLQGGVHGTKESVTRTIQLLDQNVDIPISRPPIDQLTFEIDVVHDSSYAGTVPAKDAVVDYIGGTFADDSTTTGIKIGVNVRLNEVENVIEDTQGVEYADVTLVDADGDGNDDRTTDSNGVPIYEVSDSSLARVDADDITLSETQA